MAEPNTRLGGVKQELSVFKSEFRSFGKIELSLYFTTFTLFKLYPHMEKTLHNVLTFVLVEKNIFPVCWNPHSSFIPRKTVGLHTYGLSKFLNFIYHAKAGALCSHYANQ